MVLIGDLLKKPPSFGDIWYFIRNGLLRPRDIPGILRREARRRKAGHGAPPPPDPTGARVLTESWEAALAAGVFAAPSGDGPPLVIPSDAENLLGFVTPMQNAGAVVFQGAETAPLFPALSIEAARLGLPQTAADPEAAMAARRAWIETIEVSGPLRDALSALADERIGAA